MEDDMLKWCDECAEYHDDPPACAYSADAKLIADAIGRQTKTLERLAMHSEKIAQQLGEIEYVLTNKLHS